MTALDQAFIKAFSQQGTPAAAMPPRPAAPAAKQSPPASSDAFDGVLAALEKPPGRAQTAEGGGRDQRPPGQKAERRACNAAGLRSGGKRTTRSDESRRHPLKSAADAVGSRRLNSGQSAAGSRQSAVGSGPSTASGPTTPAATVAVEDAEPARASPTAARGPLQPAAVDHPQHHRTITNPQSSAGVQARVAGGTIHLAAGLPAADWPGGRRIGPLGRRPVDGKRPRTEGFGRGGLPPGRGRHHAAAVRRAAAGGAGNQGRAGRCRPNPAPAGQTPRRAAAARLGRRSRRTKAGRSIRRSSRPTANNLALVPLAGPSAGHDPAAGDWSRLAPCIETLRKHYEMVLVDPGPLEDIGPIGDALARTAGGKIDALLLVHNQRITPEEDLDEVERRLTAAGIAVAGLIENFVVAYVGCVTPVAE